MKVHVNFTVDIDPLMWDANFGTGTEAEAVRDDVRVYAENVAVETIKNATGALIQ